MQVVNAKNGTGSATLSMAAAAARFAEACLRAQAGETGVKEFAFVQVSMGGVRNSGANESRSCRGMG